MGRISNIEIVKDLLEDGRMPYTEIAKKHNVSEATVRKRVKKMQKSGVIKKFTIEVDPRKLGYEKKAIIGIDVEPNKRISIIKLLKSKEQILNLSSSSGDHDILMECWFENFEQLSEFEEELKNIEGVTDICPAIITEIIK